MPGPWEKYAQKTAQQPAQDGPWSKYAAQSAQASQGDPPLPPGFVIEQDDPATQSAQAMQGEPPPPPGFVIEGEQQPLSIDIVGGTSVPDAEYAKDEGQSYLAGKPAAQQANPSLFRMDSDFREKSGIGAGSMFWAAAKDMFGSREGAAQYLADQYNKEHGLSAQINGGARVVQDESGDPVLRLPDGTSYRMNDAGIDSTDIGNVAGNVAAFWMPAGLAGRLGQARELGVLGRAGLQSVAAGVTDATLQAGVNGGDVDLARTGAAAAGGGLGEVAGTGLRVGGQKLGNAFRDLTGQATRDARVLAAQVGIDSAPVEAQMKSLRRGAAEVRAGADPRAIAGAERFGFQYSQGQKALQLKRKMPLLNREEALRQSPGSQHLFAQAAENNRQRLGEAVDAIGTKLGGKAGTTPAELVQGSAARLSQQADELSGQVQAAYEKAAQGNRTAVDMQYVSELPKRLAASVQDFAPNATTTPATAQTLRQLRTMTETLSRGIDGSSVKGVTLKALEAQRRILNKNIDAAANKADRAAMVTMKREFDAWLDDAVYSPLVSGNPESLAALKDARLLRREFGRRFEGGQEAEKFIAGLLDGSRTPEELVNIAMGTGSVSKAAAARFIARLEQASGGDPEVIGNLRAAHFLRLTVGKSGEPLEMGQIIRNVRSTEYSNASVLKALYSPQEWAEVRRLADALEPLVAKGDYAKSSGSAERAYRMFAQLLSRVTGGLPLVGGMVDGFAAGMNHVRANRALTQPLALSGGAVKGSQPLVTAEGREATR